MSVFETDRRPRTSYFSQKVRAGREQLLCVHLARVKKCRNGDALVSLHCDGDCDSGFTFRTDLATARDFGRLAGLIERTWHFKLKQTPRDCSHASCENG